MDNELLDELTVAASAVDSVTKLPDEMAKDLTQRLADIYVSDPSCRWWWESISVPTERIPYGCADGLLILADLIEVDCNAMLIVTDDEDPPWPVYEGKVKNLIAMLKECRFFEYILVAKDASWVVFDTHMNEFVIAQSQQA